MILYDLTISIINISSKQQNYKVHQAPRFELGWYMLDFLRSPLGCTGFENLANKFIFGLDLNYSISKCRLS